MSGDRWWQGYDAVLFDLDGTLVTLGVDWRAVEDEVGTVLEDAGVDADAYSAWELLDAAESIGIGQSVDGIIADHEVAGARETVRLPLADDVARIDVPIGVVSLNAVSAVRLALEREGLFGHVDAVLGWDSTTERKPHPEPLLEALSRLEVPPESSIFVGDSKSDETAAMRAGVDFRWVEG